MILLLGAALCRSSARAFRPTTLLRSPLVGRSVSSLRAEEERSSGEDDDADMYDLVVIGGGSGGVRASRISAGYGKKVAILEPQLQHGVPPNYSAIGGTVRRRCPRRRCRCQFEWVLHDAISSAK
jgi:hypothetical protein